jgi:hypothetical protein
MPILNSVRGNIGVTGFNSGLLVGAYQSIQTSTVTGSSAADITFSNIPNTFTHLEIRFSILCTSANDIYTQYNSDTASNYRYHLFQTNGVAVYSDQNTSTGNLIGPIVASPSPCCGIIQIMDYANTNKFKTNKSLVNSDNNGGGYVTLSSSMWRNTNAISTIRFYAGQNFLVNSRVSLYGIVG